MKTQETKLAKSTKCQVCKCTIIVRKHAKLPARTMRALAVANHVKTLHSNCL